MTPHYVQRFAPAVPNACQLCPYNWQSCAERSIVMYAIWGLSVFCACSMRISSSRKVLMNSSAFHELTGKAIRGILPLDLSLSWQQRAYDAHCCPVNNSTRIGISCLSCGKFADSAQNTQFLLKVNEGRLDRRV